jgi:monoamine oxidase
MSRLPNAFKPLVKDDLKYNRKIEKLEYDECDKKVRVSWKNKFTDREFESVTYDYALVAVLFTVTRKWQLPGTFPD